MPDDGQHHLRALRRTGGGGDGIRSRTVQGCGPLGKSDCQILVPIPQRAAGAVGDGGMDQPNLVRVRARPGFHAPKVHNRRFRLAGYDLDGNMPLQRVGKEVINVLLPLDQPGPS